MHNLTDSSGSPSGCCADHRHAMTSRRGLLRGLAAGGATTVFGSTIVTMSGAAAVEGGTPRVTTPASSVIVVVSLRGAADGLSLVVPHGDPAYYEARPTIAVPAEALLARDDYFGLHPAMESLVPLWTSGRLAAVNATGLPVANRSHFAAMEAVEDAAPGSRTRSGWLNRLVGAGPERNTLEAVSMGGSIPTSLLGAEPVMAMSSIASAGLTGVSNLNDPNDPRMRSLRIQWQRAGGEIGDGFRAAMDAAVDLGPAKAATDNTSSYPNTSLGRAMSSVARTLRGDVGVSVVTVDSGNWDMHSGQGTATSGWLVNNAKDLAGSIAAFFGDLGPVADKVTLVTISEFGRRVVENGNRGTDHGWGNVMFVAGAGVKGGRYYGRWPGLDKGLDADVKVTTDYRSVLSEIVTTRTDASSATVFPGFAPESVGVMSRD
ncbi:DUF1501 domain-containing protein [Nocardioides ferulae]|uniref:DUF1501 domain-containing protein n=1 Tax=Nocardioides ferulae TaxID=2340821 RepID=UPI000EACE340|nr:DUF1501 domain-containing protein [Nocardioides ferulae]